MTCPLYKDYTRECIEKLFATWRLQGKNVFDELEKLLRRELCLS